MLFVIPKSVADSVYDTMQFHAAVKVTCIAVQVLQGSIYGSTIDALDQAA